MLHTKFVLKLKPNELGVIDRYKARLEVCGKEEDRTEHDCFSPVVGYTVIKLLLYQAIRNRWIVRRFDFENAFPSGKPEPAVYNELQK